jgi:hypothetical protein
MRQAVTHFFNRDGGRSSCDLDGQVGDPRHFFQREDRARGKSPSAVVQNPHTEAYILGIANGRHAPVLAADRLRGAVLDADVAVLGARRGDARQRKVGELIPRRSRHRVAR